MENGWGWVRFWFSGKLLLLRMHVLVRTRNVSDLAVGVGGVSSPDE